MATEKTAKKASKKTAKKTTKKAATSKKSGAAKKTEQATEKPAATSEKAKPQEAPGTVELIDLEQLAAELNLPQARIRKMIRSGQIRGVKVDGEWRFNFKLVQQTLGRRSRGR